MRLSGLLGNKPKPFQATAVPSLNRVYSICGRIRDQWPDVILAPEQDQEAIVQEMLRRIERRDWEKATLGAVIRAGRVAFEPAFRDLRKLHDFYVKETEASTSTAFVGAMMSIYLASYEPDAPHSRDLAAALTTSRDRLGRKWSDLLERVPYLLDARRATRRIGAAMFAMDDPYSELIELGFQDPYASGLMHHAHLAYVKQMEPTLQKESGVRRMLSWLTSGREPKANGAKEAIEALLRPWTSNEPGAAIKEMLTEELVASYGDPRVRLGGVWRQVSSDCREVLLRWLTGANIEFFLDVVTAVETSHMWQPRREFWWDLYEQGEIDAAWVAFSPNAVETAERLRQDRAKTGKLEYGRQTAGGSRRTTSLLILKIGRCIVVEGSHNYMVQIFKESSPHAPRLYKNDYDCERIRLAPGHHHQQAHHWNWQDRVLEHIAYSS